MSYNTDLNFLSVVAQGDLTTNPERVQVHEGGDRGKLRDILLTRQGVQDERDKLKKCKSPGRGEIL